MLHFIQHDKRCHSERSEESTHQRHTAHANRLGTDWHSFSTTKRTKCMKIFQNSVFIATTKAAFLLFLLRQLMLSSFAFLFGTKRVKIFIFRCFLENEQVVFPTKQDYNYEYCHLREQSHH